MKPDIGPASSPIARQASNDDLGGLRIVGSLKLKNGRFINMIFARGYVPPDAERESRGGIAFLEGGDNARLVARVNDTGDVAKDFLFQSFSIENPNKDTWSMPPGYVLDELTGWFSTIVARLLCLQSEAQRSTRRRRGASGGSGERRMRPLQKWRFKRVTEYVDKHLAEKITLSGLAAVAGLSPMHFASQFRAATNLRPHDYLLLRRIKRAEELLRQSTMTLVEISLTVGFQTQAHFTTVFKRFVGDTPYKWRRAEVRVSPSVTAAEVVGSETQL